MIKIGGQLVIDDDQNITAKAITIDEIATIANIELSGKINITSIGSQNVMMGVWGSTNPDVSGVTDNIILGNEAGASFVSGATQNIIIGTEAGQNMATVDKNIAIGYRAGQWVESNENIFIGWGAGQGHTEDPLSGYRNTFIGQGAGGKCFGANQYNTAIGFGTMANAGADDSGSMNSNTCIGSAAGMMLADGDGNTFIGDAAGGTLTESAENTVCLGNGAPFQGDNTIMLGNSNTDSSAGLFCYDMGIASPSDVRIKDSITNISYGLDFINELRPVSYQKKHPADYPSEFLEERFSSGEDKKKDNWTAKTEVGLIAQEVKEVINSLGIEFHGHHTMLSGMESLKYVAFITPLIKATQELSAKIDALETKNDTLENRLDALEN